MTVAARLTLVEAAVARLVSSRGPKVSDLMRQARARTMAGAPPPVQVYDAAELEAEARLPELRGEMARSSLRMLRGPVAEGPPAAMAEPQDAESKRGGCK